MEAYNNPIKNKVREKILRSAVHNLTKRHYSSKIIQHEELKITCDHFIDLIEHGQKGYIDKGEVLSLLNEWLVFDTAVDRQKLSAELKVLYLCGPDPTNDLEVLLDQGVNINNIWAVVSGEDSIAAHKAINEHPDRFLKIHEGSLHDFFQHNNEKFDLIYFDACSAFMQGKPNVLHSIFGIFHKERLNTNSVLITNYTSIDGSVKIQNDMSDLATAFYCTRSDDLLPEVIKNSGLDPAIFCTDNSGLRKFVTKNICEIYPDLITDLTTGLASNIIPALKAYSMPAFLKQYANNEENRAKLIIKQSEGSGQDWRDLGDFNLNPTSYPLYHFINELKKSNGNHILIKKLEQSFTHYLERLQTAELTRSVIEGNGEILSPALADAIKMNWFDYKARISCDIPFPNLITSSLTGTYGRPYFPNPRLSERYSYKAQTRRMYCDVIYFEQCRSFFDWFPTINQSPSRFKNHAFQVVARSIIDRIHWSQWYNDANPFRGGAIACKGETKVAKPLKFAERKYIE